MGNPVFYYNGMEFTWENGSNLTSIDDWGFIYTYTYNENGIRTSKTSSGITHTYHLDGTKILSEEFGNKLIIYVYDESGSIIGMAYRESSYAKDVFDYYLFTKNLQGDIIGIYDVNGNRVASYTYNAWGECHTNNYTSAMIGSKNPFRYRGYYYDTETGFYYLNTRYYDPQIKRFISPDAVNNLGANGDLNSYNLYAYCRNNPVMFVDSTGEIAWGIVLLIVVAVVAIVNDVNEIREITSNFDERVDVSEETGTITIDDSYDVVTPLGQYGFGFYLNHINPKTKDVIKGSTFGVYYEWAVHNLACDVGIAFGITSFVDSGEDLSVGATIFNDYNEKDDVWRMAASKVMTSCYKPTLFGLNDYEVYRGIK